MFRSSGVEIKVARSLPPTSREIHHRSKLWSRKKSIPTRKNHFGRPREKKIARTHLCSEYWRCGGAPAEKGRGWEDSTSSIFGWSPGLKPGGQRTPAPRGNYNKHNGEGDLQHTEWRDARETRETQNFVVFKEQVHHATILPPRR